MNRKLRKAYWYGIAMVVEPTILGLGKLHSKTTGRVIAHHRDALSMLDDHIDELDMEKVIMKCNTCSADLKAMSVWGVLHRQERGEKLVCSTHLPLLNAWAKKNRA